jgi:hypothetical protein
MRGRDDDKFPYAQPPWPMKNHAQKETAAEMTAPTVNALAPQDLDGAPS